MDNAGEVAADWLESAGRDHVDTLVLSHLHADHCNGVTMLLELIPVEEIVFSPNADADEEMLPEILNAAQKHNTRVTELRADTEMSYGKLRLRMFAPPESGNENERCIISLLSVGDYDMLFTGDAPKKAERDLLEHTELPDAELLIVGHHGSRSSSDGSFLAAIRAETAVISVGNNSFGHPTWEVLERLEAYGSRVYRTDLNGTVELRIGSA